VRGVCSRRVAMLPVDREANDSSVEAIQGGEVWTNEARLVAGLATRRRGYRWRPHGDSVERRSPATIVATVAACDHVHVPDPTAMR
jgi:hypothetical protein